MEGMDVDFLLGKLLEMHKLMTQQQPICTNRVTISTNRPTSFEDISDLTDRSFDIFNKRNLPRGSVHLDPKFWTTIFLTSVNKSLKESQTSGVIEVLIPNGCCTNKECPIAIFYEILASCYNESFSKPAR